MTKARGDNHPPAEEELFRTFGELGFVTRSPRLVPLLQQVWKVARVSDASVLIEGESGTGKMVVAEAIHRLDPKRAEHRFVTAPCAAISGTVAESELFGHTRGAFSGAVEERLGLFRAGDRGTVFLDDVSDLSASLQPKLLDVLQRRTVRAVGSDREHRVDVRTIVATNTPLESLVARGAFRADLLYRLEVIKVRLPPLRERGEDFATLVLALAARHQDLYGPIRAVEPALAERLSRARWPGNVRQLEHEVERMLFAKTSGDTLGLDDLPAQPEDPVDADPISDAAVEGAWVAIRQERVAFGDVVRRFEQRLLGRALVSEGATRRELASMLGMSERCLYKKLSDLRIAPGEGLPEVADRSRRAAVVPGSPGREPPHAANRGDAAGAPGAQLERD